MNTQYPSGQDHLGLINFVRDTRHLFVRHKKRMISFFVGTMAIVVVGIIVCPRKYISEAKLFVRVGRESIGLDPTATTGQTLPLHESRENEITSVLDILGSRVILESVVDQLGPGLILDGISAETVEPNMKNPKELDQSAALRREKAIRHLDSEIKKIHTKKSNVLGLTYRDRTPELAQRILQAFVDEFRAVHVGANRTSGSFKFFEEQAELLRKQFGDASRELNIAKDSINAVSVEQRRASLQNHLSTIETSILTTQADLDSTEASILGLKQTLTNLPQKTLAQEVSGFPDDAIGTTQKRLYDLELREQELLTQYTERYPLVIAVRRQIDAARTILDDRATLGSQATNAKNPAYQQLQLKKLEQESQAIAYRAKLTSLSTQFTDIKTQLKRLNSQETRIVELQQRVDLLRDKYGAYSEKLEQARIDQALEANHISNVNVVQPPTYIAKPVSPRKALTLVLGFLFASIGAVCFAFVSELFDESQIPQNDAIAASATFHTEHKSENIGDAISEVEQLVEQSQC